MKTLKHITIMIAGALLIASCAGPSEKAAEISERLEPGEKPENAIVKTLDVDRSVVAWEGTKITGAHDGTIALKSGELYMVDNQIVGGNIVIDMTRIVVLDIEDPATNARLKGHLESDDFFSVASFPEAKFEMANIVKREDAAEGQPNYTISGNLTIKGITHGITFPAFVTVADGSVTAQADFDLDRTRWDVRFGSGRFFEGLGDNLIHDNFNIKLDILATR
ncbi:MAG: YceI family protein [Bacteroidales bacterium]